MEASSVKPRLTLTGSPLHSISIVFNPRKTLCTKRLSSIASLKCSVQSRWLLVKPVDFNPQFNHFNSSHSTNSYFPLKNGQPCCGSKIDRPPNSGKIVNLFFSLCKTFFHDKPNMFIFEFHFCINHCSCQDTKMQRFLENRYIYFLPICLIDF